MNSILSFLLASSLLLGSFVNPLFSVINANFSDITIRVDNFEDNEEAVNYYLNLITSSSISKKDRWLAEGIVANIVCTTDFSHWSDSTWSNIESVFNGPNFLIDDLIRMITAFLVTTGKSFGDIFNTSDPLELVSNLIDSIQPLNVPFHELFGDRISIGAASYLVLFYSMYDHLEFHNDYIDVDPAYAEGLASIIEVYVQPEKPYDLFKLNTYDDILSYYTADKFNSRDLYTSFIADLNEISLNHKYFAFLPNVVRDPNYDFYWIFSSFDYPPNLVSNYKGSTFYTIDGYVLFAIDDSFYQNYIVKTTDQDGYITTENYNSNWNVVSLSDYDFDYYMKYIDSSGNVVSGSEGYGFYRTEYDLNYNSRFAGFVLSKDFESATQYSYRVYGLKSLFKGFINYSESLHQTSFLFKFHSSVPYFKFYSRYYDSIPVFKSLNDFKNYTIDTNVFYQSSEPTYQIKNYLYESNYYSSTNTTVYNQIKNYITENHVQYVTNEFNEYVNNVYNYYYITNIPAPPTPGPGGGDDPSEDVSGIEGILQAIKHRLDLIWSTIMVWMGIDLVEDITDDSESDGVSLVDFLLIGVYALMIGAIIFKFIGLIFSVLGWVIHLFAIEPTTSNLPDVFVDTFRLLRGEATPENPILGCTESLKIFGIVSIFDFMVILFEIAFIGAVFALVRKYSSQINVSNLKG